MSCAEACFSIEEHLDLVEQRVERLCQLAGDVGALAKEQIWPGWVAIQQWLRGEVVEEIPLGKRVLSPSDFGFHNAILRPNGKLCFIDFEYAGWDDPAKLVCDFFCQPKFPVPFDFFEDFFCQVAGVGSEEDELRLRVNLLLPVYRIKWCCIILARFQPEGAERRRFSGEKMPSEEMNKNAIEMAKQMLARALDVL